MKNLILTALILAAIPLLGTTPQIIDSKMSFAEATKGTKAPKEVLDSITLLDVHYYSTDNKIHQGQILVNKAVAEDVKFFFDFLLKEKFPIKQVIPIVKYKWDDEASMSANNSSAFNYRFVAGTTRLSNHSFGRALDINPYFNPVIYMDPPSISPKGAKYIPGNPGVFTAQSKIVIEMKKHGWRWGGDWHSLKDNHHFDKP
jgi:hypothetical protein